MALTLAYMTDDLNEQYEAQLSSAISVISPLLLSNDVWDQEFANSVPKFVNKHIGAKSPISFASLPSSLKLELKLYWAKLLSDDRCNSMSAIERRRQSMRWFNSDGANILSDFNVKTLSDIPHPEFPINCIVTSRSIKKHNDRLLELYSCFEGNGDRPPQKICVVDDATGRVNQKEYLSTRVTIIGDFHKQAIINREQLQPMNGRNIIFINDLYSEENVRFKDKQRQTDTYLNFFLFPPWLRDAAKTHLLQKISFGELAPGSLLGYFSRLLSFRDFMHERFDIPRPKLVTVTLIEDNYVAWGNEKGLAGKNWFTDTLAMLSTAGRMWPNEWPSLSVSNRAARKIKKTHYKQGLGRIGQNQEGAGRSYSQRIVDELNRSISSAPDPIHDIFSIIMGTGMRAEDGHALLFDCLKDDPNDNDFMLLTFWQNKVRKWNTKPLLKKDKGHAYLIDLIAARRKKNIHKYGRETKYLFPSFTGTQENFLTPGWTVLEIKKRCIADDIRDETNKPLSFSWHPLRHTKGTSLAKEGHDVMSIMMELGHASPDMAAVYVNNRLELKKQALMEKGSGKFFTIEGKVDTKIMELMVRKEQLSATRVCGGACSMPSQLGDWCEHANACYTCKHYRADGKDIEFFKHEKLAITDLIEQQKIESNELNDAGHKRMAEILQRRMAKNMDINASLGNIIQAIETTDRYQGDKPMAKKMSLEQPHD